MKQIILLIAVTMVFSCKSEKKKSPKIEAIKYKEEAKVLSEVKIPNLLNWYNNGIDMTEATILYSQEQVYNISRKNPDKPAHMAINNLEVFSGSTYRISVILKKGEVSSHFGLRVQGVYPNRVDVVYNLDKATINGPVGTGDLSENEKASIENLGDGWYKCILTIDLYSKYIRLVFGPTKNTMKNTLWETKTLINNDVYIVPSSLKIEEL